MNLFRIFFPNRYAQHERNRVGPSGFLFLRNYKKTHFDRIQKAIITMSLGGNIAIVQEAFDNHGDLIQTKLAVYAASQEAEGLFFQSYAAIKAEEHVQAISQVSKHT